ncbi:MAG TPA: SdpI family protein [Rhizomicrobium sp.]|nr:SdpI family protein [Rhizomicrobium sp.]
MNTRTPLLVSLLLLAVVGCVTAWGWMAIPAGVQIAVHWGINGQPNGWTSKNVGLLLTPILAVGLVGMFWLIPRIEPRRRNLGASRPFYVTGWLGSLALLVVVQVVTVLYAKGVELNVGNIATVSVAVLLLAMGNFLGKTRANFFAGVRTPWSLSSDFAWEKSNRAAGRLFVITGLATLAALLAGGMKAAGIVLIAGLLVAATVSVVLSYVYWRRDPHKHTVDMTPE